MIDYAQIAQACADHDSIAEEHATPEAACERAGVDWHGLDEAAGQRALRMFNLIVGRPVGTSIVFSELNEQEKKLLLWMRILWCDSFLAGVECARGIGHDRAWFLFNTEGLSQDEVDGLVGEVLAQAERSERHPSVEVEHGG